MKKKITETWGPPKQDKKSSLLSRESSLWPQVQWSKVLFNRLGLEMFVKVKICQTLILKLTENVITMFQSKMFLLFLEITRSFQCISISIWPMPMNSTGGKDKSRISISLQPLFKIKFL